MFWLYVFVVLTDLLTAQISDEPSQFAEGERPRPQGSSPVLEFPESEKYSDSEVQPGNVAMKNRVSLLGQRAELDMATTSPRR